MLEMKEFPTDVSGYYEKIDPDDIYRTQISGLFRRTLTVERDGSTDENSFGVYIPENYHSSGFTVVIVPPSGQEISTFLEASGWKKTADKYQILLHILKPDMDLAYARAIAELTRDRTYYNVNKALVYLIGYGNGARTAQLMALDNPWRYGGVVCVGDYGVSEEILEKWGQRQSDYDFMPMKDVPLPVTLLDIVYTAAHPHGTRDLEPQNLETGTPTHISRSPKEAVIAYWKRANKVEESPCQRDGLSLWLASEKTNASLIEEIAGAPVRVGTIKAEDVYVKTEFLWNILSLYIRPIGIANGHLRPRRTIEQWGAVTRKIRVDQYLREWIEYVPSKVKRDSSYKAPVVVCFHGGSNRGETAMVSTDWVKVAEARNFIVLFPSGSMRRLADKGWLPHPAWNAGCVADIMDDVKFIKAMLEDVFSRYNVDRERVYANGHSMGACMCQKALLAMPEYFTAGGSTGGVLKKGFFGDFDDPDVKEGYKMPLWIVMGENDYNGGTYDNPKNGTLRNAEYWTKRNETRPVDKPLTYRTGLYATKVYTNQQGVPLLQFTTVDYKPHCSTAQDSWFFYDEWFSKFTRKKDGTLVYMNEIEVK